MALGAITTPVVSPTCSYAPHLDWQTIEQRRIATNRTMLYKISPHPHMFIQPLLDPINQSIKKFIPHIDNHVQHIQEELCGKGES